MGVYGTSTFHQGDPQSPPPHPAPPTSQCTPVNNIGGTISATPPPSSAYPPLCPTRTVNRRLLGSLPGSSLPGNTNTTPQQTGTVCHSPRYLYTILLLTFFSSANIQNTSGGSGSGRSALGFGLELIGLGSFTFLVGWILVIVV